MLTILYYLQLEGYSIKSLLKRFKGSITRYVVYLIVYILTLLIITFVFSKYLIDEFLFVLFGSCFINCLYLKNINKLKLKFTKRLLRIILASTVVMLLNICCICVFCDLLIVVRLFPFVIFVNYIAIIISLVLLLPIEKIIGNYYLRKAKVKINKYKKLIKIGITGSFGKTTVKEILSSILREEYIVLSTPKSYNTPFGISKTINNALDNRHEIFVCEMGAKKRGEIRELCNLVDCDMGIVTTVGRQHTNTFGGINGVYLTKKELPDFLCGKRCVFNLMNLYTRKMYFEYVGDKIGVFLIRKHNLKGAKQNLKSKSFIVNKASRVRRLNFYIYLKYNNYYAKRIKCSGNGSVFDVYCGDGYLFNVETFLIGEHNVINVLLAIAMAKKLNVSNCNIISAIKGVVNINARLEKFLTKSGAIVINNGYNSNIDSAKSTLKTLELFDKKHKVVITPGLIETEDDFEYNKIFGKLLGLYATNIVIVKETNKNALIAGLKDSGLDMNNVSFAKSFDEARVVIDKADKDTIFLIENDLPDSFK